MKERIIEFCKAKRIAPTKFCLRVGWQKSTLSNWDKGVRSDRLEQVAKEFPELNMRWLLTGEGDMFGGYSGTPMDVKSEDWYRSQLEKKDEQIEVLNKQLSLLMRLIEKGETSKNISQSFNL